MRWCPSVPVVMCTIGREWAASAYGYHQWSESPQFVKNCQTAGCLPVWLSKRLIGRTLPVTPAKTFPAAGRYGFAAAHGASASSASADVTKRLASERDRAAGQDVADEFLRALLGPAA